MAKKNKEDQILTPAAALMIPDGSAMGGAEIEKKISKGDLINIMTIGIKENLRKELEAASKKVYDASAEVDEAYRELLDKVSKELSRITGITIAPNTLKLELLYDSSHRYEVSLPNLRNRGYEEPKVTPIKIGTQKIDIGVISMVNINRFIVSSEEVKIAKEKHAIVEKEFNEINSRVNRAGNKDYLRAQLDMALLGGTTQGQQTAGRMQNLIDSLTNTVFAKNPTPLVLKE